MSFHLTAGSHHWLFKELSLQEGYPQPLPDLRMKVRAEDDDGDKEEETATWRRGLGWDPEEGPVWRDKGDAEEEKQENVWSQLLREGVSGITTGNNGVWCVSVLGGW